jgi:tetratricopeptide (TPR) repeat protein
MSPGSNCFPSGSRLRVARLIGFLLLAALFCSCDRRPSSSAVGPGDDADEFARWMSTGKNYYDQDQAERAIEPFKRAVALNANAPEAHLNLANAFLLAGRAVEALAAAERALELDHHLAAAYYVAGCAQSRLRQFEEALRNFQMSRDLEPKVGATTFQLGSAHQELGHWEEAVAAFEELVSFEPDHPAAWYKLSQCLIRAGRPEEAASALDRHREEMEKRGPAPPALDLTKLERCVHTEARAPFLVDPPSPTGVSVVFRDVTAEVLPEAGRYSGPVAFIDYHRDDRNSLFVGESGGFRLLINSNGVFHPHSQGITGEPGTAYRRFLVADLQNDRFEDVLALGEQGSRVFRFATNAQITETTLFSQMHTVKAREGVLVDLDFTGKLDLVAVEAAGDGIRVLRNLGNMYFKDGTATSGVPANLTSVTSVAIEDWNHDEQLDVIVARGDEPPLLLLKERGGLLVPTNSPPNWPSGSVLTVGDFNNDIRGDLAIAAPDGIHVLLNGMTNRFVLPVPGSEVRELLPLDYDNDAWLDLVVAGRGLRVFRNLGPAGFVETTDSLGLARWRELEIDGIAAADWDIDGDTDLAISVIGQGLRLLRNDGGNANLQVKVRLFGNRSNASGLGTRVEISSAGLRIGRRVDRFPIEIGVGQHKTLESLNARWLNLSLHNVDVEVDPRVTLPLWELVLPEGSCPYLYAWDGERFRFVTDLLGSAPLGLRISADRFVEADPDEYVWLGGEESLAPREGAYELRITEELREVLYLDAAELVVVDHPMGTEVYTTGKMVPGRPFPRHELITVGHLRPLRRATRSDGLDVTGALREVDRVMASPVALRIPQLRGLAEPWFLVLDFGPLPVDRPLVLGLTGWLRFGGGMANVAASQHPDLPFPFPTLEVETAPDQWQPVDVVFGVPSGKTKNLVVELEGKLPPGSQRLRIQTAYEVHWDRIALLERVESTETRVTRVLPDSATLRFRGFSEFKDLPWTQPLTPDYDRVSPNPSWRITPAGWCTRYGDVLELVTRRDNALALLNGGDELILRFAVDPLPELSADLQRGFFLYSSGWDKDSDFHCEKGWQVGPLPWHGMDDQQYGRQERPVMDGDWWIPKYNTRWVGPWVLRRPEGP